MMTIKPFLLNKTWCDWSKFIAAILVAMSHYATCVCVTHHWSDDAILRLWCQGGNLGVALFFLLSGYGLMESELKHHLTFFEFIKKRFAKVYLPVLFVSLIWVPLCLLYKEHYQPDSLFAFIYDILWGFNDSVLWFVKILFCLYGLFFIYTKCRVLGYELISLLILIIGTLVIQIIANRASFPYISVPLFGIGVLSSHYKEKSIGCLPVGLCLLFILIVIYGIFFLAIRDSHYAHGTINGVFCCIVLIIILLLPPPRVIRKLEFIQES